MDNNFEYCPVKSFVCKSLRHPFSWVLGGIAFGALSMYALGKVSDIEKIVWFAAGTAITAIATVVQSHLSNIRSLNEHKFQAELSSSRLKHEEQRQLRENTTTLRLSAYESFLQASSQMIAKNYDSESMHQLMVAFSRVRLLTVGPILIKCNKIYKTALKIRAANREKKDLGELPSTYGVAIREVIQLMREDIGRSSVCIVTSEPDSIPLQSTE